MSDKPILLAPEQASQMLCLPTSRLARWRCKGVGPNYIKIEGRVLYNLDDLFAFLGGNQVRPMPRRARRKGAPSNSKAHGPRPAFAETDRLYFDTDRDAQFRVRRWTPEDDLCGEISFGERVLAEAMVLVFRCGARIPANLTPGDPKGLVLSDFLVRFARRALASLPEYGQDWPPQA